jgi:type II secretory ATPase GspE/PulE/Tfp pilus assembly ATPase PilB-like protein
MTAALPTIGGHSPAAPSEVLCGLGLQEHQVDQAVRRLESREPLWRIARDTGYLTEEGVATALASMAGLEYAGRSLVDEVDAQALSDRGVRVQADQDFAPVGFSADGGIIVAIPGTESRAAAHNALRGYGVVRYVIASPSTIDEILHRAFADSAQPLGTCIGRAEAALLAGSGTGSADQQAIRRLLGTLLRHASGSRASDLRLYSTLYCAIINARFDGIGKDLTEISRPLLDALWILMANDARIRAEGVINRLVEGAITFQDDAPMREEFSDVFDRYSFRLELGATAGGGRSASIRILDSRSVGASITELGYEGHDLAQVRRVLAQPDGLVLLTGPTGSGKTTSLYAMLETLDSERLSIQTIENPVERRHGKWLQYEVGKASSDTERDVFLEHFRQLLRNDPDVIMLGEIRSREVARLAIQAAQTGHMVFSTLHVDRAAQVFGRFRGLGVDPRELCEHLSLVVSQRLVRRLCPRCRVPDERAELPRLLGTAMVSWLEWDPKATHRAGNGGCPHCNHTGYRGRMVVYEMLEIDAGVRSMVEGNVGGLEMEQRLFGGGRSLWDQGLRLVARGQTSIDALRESVREPR